MKGYSIPRYPELMRIFRDLGLVEQLGTGVMRILKVYNEDVFEFNNYFIRVNFKYRDNSELEDNKNINDRDVSKVQNQILNLIDNDKYLTQEELSKILGKGRSTIAKNIKILKDNGYLDRIGSDKNGFWKVLK